VTFVRWRCSFGLCHSNLIHSVIISPTVIIVTVCGVFQFRGANKTEDISFF